MEKELYGEAAISSLSSVLSDFEHQKSCQNNRQTKKTQKNLFITVLRITFADV
jgi:hypothetical protein